MQRKAATSGTPFDSVSLVKTHHLRTHRSDENLEREGQLAWQLAAVAIDPVDVEDDVVDMVVNRVIDEKLNDGQLSESPLTLAEMTLIRSAFLDSLVGHYHQRIAYPNFPGS